MVAKRQIYTCVLSFIVFFIIFLDAHVHVKVWDRSTFQVKITLHGHTGSVLALEIAREKEWLFSSSSE